MERVKMIEKLDRRLRQERDSGFTISEPVSIGEMQEKINELVDAVNELQATISKMKNVECSENVQPVAETRSENVQDKFAEQRKWIGCLCKFRQGVSSISYGILSEILTDSDLPYYKKDTDTYWKYCEPVKPDDPIIYKGAKSDCRY